MLRRKKPNLPKVVKVTKKSVSSKKSSRSKPGRGARRKSNTVAKSQGAVDTYKSFDFKSTVNTLVAKGGAVKNVKVAENTDVIKGLSGVEGAGKEGQTVKRSKLSEVWVAWRGQLWASWIQEKDWREFLTKRSLIQREFLTKQLYWGEWILMLSEESLKSTFPNFVIVIKKNWIGLKHR